ncbi:hypothetical protein BGLA2_300057 [Burkholderia gladioli]|nr:hypothetical protein BGLA2_300057 [Burkholderia gladioli]
MSDTIILYENSCQQSSMGRVKKSLRLINQIYYVLT